MARSAGNKDVFAVQVRHESNCTEVRERQEQNHTTEAQRSRAATKSKTIQPRMNANEREFFEWFCSTKNLRRKRGFFGVVIRRKKYPATIPLSSLFSVTPYYQAPKSSQAEKIFGLPYPRSSAQIRGKFLFVFHQCVSVLLSVFISGKVFSCGYVWLRFKDFAVTVQKVPAAVLSARGSPGLPSACGRPCAAGRSF